LTKFQETRNNNYEYNNPILQPVLPRNLLCRNVFDWVGYRRLIGTHRNCGMRGCCWAGSPAGASNQLSVRPDGRVLKQDQLLRVTSIFAIDDSLHKLLPRRQVEN
jgi:hypothetical protein